MDNAPVGQLSSPERGDAHMSEATDWSPKPGPGHGFTHACEERA
nr:MAG TPA: hypothetical protein [Caudoviricetes sp.]